MESDAVDAKIQMTATVLKNEIERDLKDDGFTETDGVYTKIWTADQFSADEMSLNADGDLVLAKKVTRGCVKTEVDDTTLCIGTGHTLDFKVFQKRIYNFLSIFDPNLKPKNLGTILNGWKVLAIDFENGLSDREPCCGRLIRKKSIVG